MRCFGVVPHCCPVRKVASISVYCVSPGSVIPDFVGECNVAVGVACGEIGVQVEARGSECEPGEPSRFCLPRFLSGSQYHLF